MKNSEIRELTTEDLKERILAERTNLTKMTMNHVVSPLENPMQIRAVRRDIARMLTELRKRELTVK
ncbi:MULTISPECIES: 50S ribosomal protein L29 [Porphyromonadaceae]|uniref:Large ribosomal subunit protein uL29 n=1 Tax=Sanguibacteroides justesenii TaxID=1547597 RepID=A0A0C3N9S2_9PORP|nr:MULTISPECIES: 50S ribosomal protein L29 [Porphyromonadaceae]KIO42782.1 50S ribosomal protein L29 [Sanguibacteroides justesenii]KIO45098.1 50S ribosomal protein L29 [Sanguibacteroides justesenii]MCR9010994.1 50S ribosomal protein L29 [Gabonibacter chumensis]PXZ44099.1 50S ribosomal protein L29 [Sanguibacteroides justesenii]